MELLECECRWQRQEAADLRFCLGHCHKEQIVPLVRVIGLSSWIWLLFLGIGGLFGFLARGALPEVEPSGELRLIACFFRGAFGILEVGL